MKKRKNIIIFGGIFAFLLLFTVKANATETFSTSDGIIATKIVEGMNGNIEFSISNIPLKAQEEYEWGISKTSSKEDVTKWYDLSDYNESNKSAKINLLVSEKDVFSILRTTDIAYLYIKDVKAGTYIVDALKVDLTLPPYRACELYEWLKDYYFIGGTKSSGTLQWSWAIYNIKNVSYKFVKVTDENLIQKYNQAIDNKTSIEDVFSINVKDIASLTGWESCVGNDVHGYTKILQERLPTDGGLYILYMKAKDSDSKTVYGYRTWPSGLKKVPIENNNESNVNNVNKGPQEGSTTNKGNSTIVGKTDTTTAKQILPNTGVTKIIILTIVVLGIVGTIGYIKDKNLPIK